LGRIWNSTAINNAARRRLSVRHVRRQFM
jgi:hypothetical protein